MNYDVMFHHLTSWFVFNRNNISSGLVAIEQNDSTIGLNVSKVCRGKYISLQERQLLQRNNS